MAVTMIDSRIFRDWFGSQEMREIFTDEYRLQRWLDVEAALARVQSNLGMIPKEAAQEISAKAKVENLNLDEFKESADRTVHPIMPLIWGLQKVCQKAFGEYIHWGPTTQDIELRKSNGILRILLRPPHPPLSPEYGGEDKGEGVCGTPIFVPLFMQKSIK